MATDLHMPALSRAYEIMRLLKGARPTSRFTQATIAEVIGVPPSSVHKTISVDFPECFEKRPHVGYRLTGLYPLGETVDLGVGETVPAELSPLPPVTPITYDLSMVKSALAMLRGCRNSLSAATTPDGWFAHEPGSQPLVKEDVMDTLLVGELLVHLMKRYLEDYPTSKQPGWFEKETGWKGKVIGNGTAN